VKGRNAGGFMEAERQVVGKRTSTEEDTKEQL
jgi:hypothetical protein